VEALQNDYQTAAISEQDRAMLDYVMKLTKDATKVRRKIMRNSEPLVSTTGAFCKSH